MLNLKQIGSNQTVLELGKTQVFFSYETPIAACVDGHFYRTKEKYSSTTTKHINKWLANYGDSFKATEVNQSFLNELLKD